MKEGRRKKSCWNYKNVIFKSSNNQPLLNRPDKAMLHASSVNSWAIMLTILNALHVCLQVTNRHGKWSSQLMANH